MGTDTNIAGGEIPWQRISAAIGSNLLARIAAIVVLLASLAYLAMKAHIDTSMDDGDQFWYAGWLWNHGISPYGDTFQRLHKLALPKGSPPFFIYPLHFWLLCAPLALVSDHGARIIWNGLNLILLVAGAGLWWRVARGWGQVATLQASLLLFAATIMTGTGFAMQVGQTSFLMWFGIALLADGIIEKSRWRTALGLVLLLLKPQFGLIFSVAFALCYRDLRTILTVAALVLLGSIPAWVIGGPGTPLDFLHTLSSWADFPFNRLSSMTGLGNLVSIGTGVELSKQLLIIAAAAFACGLILIYGRPGNRDRLFLGATIAAAALFAPLHLYDLFFVLAIPFVVLPPRTWGGTAALLIALALLIRPENIARPMGLINWTVATIGAILVIAIPLIERRLAGRAL